MAAAELAAGLRVRGVAARGRAARSLLQFARSELRELPADEVSRFFDDFNHHILEMVSSTDSNDKKAGVLAIVCLISGDCDATKTRISRYANYLRNLLPSTDVVVMELAAKTVGKLAIISGAKRAEYVEFEVKKSFEWLSVERNEGKRHAAVLILRELAVAMPTYFHQQISGFFEHIFISLKDPKALIREAGSKALQAGLVVTAQRETSKQTEKPQWYQDCYLEAMSCLNDQTTKEKGVTREDRIHGGLLIMNELLRISNAQWERKYTHLMQTLDTQQEINASEDIIMMMPRLKSPMSSRGNRIDLTGSSSSGGNLPTVIYESSVCKQLITERYEQICTVILNLWYTRSSHVQQILMIIIPRLSAFNKEFFVNSQYLKSTMRYLLAILKGREKDRNMAFTTIGLMAIAIEGEIGVQRIMDAIKMALPSNETPSKKRFAMDPAVFVCISLLGNAFGEAIYKDIKDILEPMMATGLSPALTICLRELAQTIPSMGEIISDSLLKMLSWVLMNKLLLHPGLPKNLEQQMNSSSVISESSDVSSIVLGLRTLGSFNFKGNSSLLPFVRHISNNFLQHDQQEIRLEAVKTCCRLLALPIQSKLTEHSNTVKYTVSDVLGKLLVVSITDTDCDVRYWVLASLDKTFDSYLAQIENLSSLFIAMNDEVLEIRELAICTIGRLSTVNPAYVMPSLRKTLIQFLTELEHSGMSRNKEQSARMLDHLIVNAPRLIRPYMEPILNVLVPKLKEPDSNPGVILNVLRAIGDLAEVNGDGNGLNKWMNELLQILLELLADASAPEKRSVALWVFGQLISATGQVVTPYTEFPTLMDVLINFLKTEQQPVIRRETIRVLGLLGALDPYRHKISRGMIDGQIDWNHSSSGDSKADESNFDINTTDMLVNMSSSSILEEYYPAIAISTLMKIIRDPNLSQHHTSVVQAITFIFQALGIKCVPYISQVMPSLLNVVRTADVTCRDFLFNQLATLIAIVKQHIRNYLDKIFELIKEFWTPNSPLQTTLILLVEHIALALGAEFKIYLPQLIPQILRVLSHDSSKDRKVTIKLLQALQKFGDNLDDYLHLILPTIVRLFDSNDCPIPVCKEAMKTVDHLAYCLDFTDLVSRIIHPLVRSLETCPELRSTAMDTLCAIVTQLGRKFNNFVPLVQRVINKHKISCQKYDVLISKLQSNTTLAMDEDFFLTRHWNSKQNNLEIISISSDPTTLKKIIINPDNLKLAWTASRLVSKDDWLEWLRHLSIGLLKESQSPALRSCVALAQNYSQLLRDLFNAAFVSCWTELSSDMQEELVKALKQALNVPDLPEITQTILNLAEFMEHCDRGPLPIEPDLLGQRAMNCRAYAKALHYKEEEFRNGVNSSVVESLILINNKLQQREAAEGLLEYVMNRNKVGGDQLQIQVLWYEKLHAWEKALDLYGNENTSSDQDSLLGQMRCLEALGEWGDLHKLAGNSWDIFETDGVNQAGRLAAAAAWGLGEWKSMERYVQFIPSDSQDGAFYRAVLAVHAGQFSTAQHLIEQTRDLLDTELTAMAGESYQRAYGAMVWVQMLAELEEVIQYKLIPERRTAIRSMWWTRLQGGQKLVEDWQRIIRVHRLVISPQEDIHTWLKYASLCRKSGSIKLAHKTMVMLLGIDPSLDPERALPADRPELTLAYCKLLWVDDKKPLALSQLQTFVDNNPIDLAEENPPSSSRRLLARCYLKLGAWTESLENVTELSIPIVLKCYLLATDYAPEWYKAWHAWAYMNFESVLFYKHKNGDGDANTPNLTKDSKISGKYVSQYTVPAVVGFFKSIKLSHGSSLQDTLRLLTLWFDYGQWPEVHEAIDAGIRTIEINTWLQVIPQLIARIDTPRALVGKLIHTLLIDIGKSHPQALVYPLSVASKSSFIARKNAANQILKSMCTHSLTLVNQARMASEELIRVAILWHEQWHEGLEEASRMYFGEQNIKAMFEALDPLHVLLDKGPETLKEISFNQAYGRDLLEAREWCNRYKASRKISDLNQAWDLYYHVFRRISRQLPQLTSLELQYVSPNLLNCKNLELAVPGTYRPGQEVVCIEKIQSNLQVITSKQRPRRLCIRGSNGKEYMFLLKGHEDLRQDERVMQLFGLANTLLQNDPDTFRRNLTIQRYAVIPLSTNSGLIGWVPHCDTLHSLIRDYRERKKCLLNIEHRIMLRMAADYDRLMLIQKVEVFEHALEHTQGDDLARLLWLKSPSSEVWFERRTNYTRSLAVMSMVGYILGLGDRHPSNLMLDRITGKILHIDFGDCFEVAVTRDKFPEKIPFRLTRMLINAMEVTGIEGTYRRTCESVMAVLHRNKDSLMAVLEAFVHDPLLNWRLIDTAPRSKDESFGGENSLGDSESLSVPAPIARRIHPTNPTAEGQPEALNKRALTIINRVRDKLTGRDFNPEIALPVAQQVNLLIQQATNNENLCQCYIGWCPFW